MADERTIEFAGEEFALSDKVGLMPLMRFAHIARAGVDADDMEGLDAIYTLLRQCFAPEAWRRFEDVATREASDATELLKVVTDAIGKISARPTGRPSDSSAGPPPTSASSPADSSSQVIARLEAEGRPSVAFLVDQRERSLASV